MPADPLPGQSLPRPQGLPKTYARVGGRMPPKDHRALDEHGSQVIFGMVGDVVPPLIRIPDDVAHLPLVTSSLENFLAEADHTPTSPLYIEIGSGTGDQAVAFAKEHPEARVLAIEVWVAGIAATVRSARREGTTNVKVLRADAAVALGEILPEASASEVWTFFPDPWPKVRHHHRRIVSLETAKLVSRVLVPGGIWRLATDWEDYAQWMADVLDESPHFEPLAPQGHRFSPRWEGRTMTKFERRGVRDGRQIFDLTAKKITPLPSGELNS